MAADLKALKADLQRRMEGAMETLRKEFAGLRTGRASPALLEPIRVEAYGSQMPLAQCASVSIPEPATIMIKPWDRGLIKAIEKALAEAQLGMNPASDGQVIRLNLPPLSTERRKQLAGMQTERSDLVNAIARLRRLAPVLVGNGRRGLQVGVDLEVRDDVGARLAGYGHRVAEVVEGERVTFAREWMLSLDRAMARRTVITGPLPAPMAPRVCAVLIMRSSST